MKITHTSVLVDDQQKALKFYTEVLGFQKMMDLPMGEYSWLTLVSPSDADGVELLLEPTSHPASPIYQKALYDSGIAFTMFAVDDMDAEHERLKSLGVKFTQEPTNPETGPRTAVFDDTCGNLIQIYQP